MFILDRKRNYKNHIKKLNNKEKMVAREISGVEESIYKDMYDFSKRGMLFKYLIQSVIA